MVHGPAQTSAEHIQSGPEIEWALLVECVRGFGAGSPPDAAFASGMIGCSSLAARAWYHGILHIVADRLEMLGQSDLGHDLMRIDRLRGMVSVAIWQELVHVLECFRGEGFEAIVFKGFALGERAYGRAGLRQSGDLDLLIRREHFARASDILIERGYTPRIERARIEAALEKKKNGVTFHGKLVNVDLHWTLDDYPFEFKRDTDGIWDRARTVEVAGHEILGLSPLDQFLFVCFHGSKHNWVRLIWICDVGQAARLLDATDWDHVLEHCARTRTSRMIAVALLLAESYCGFGLPAPIRTLIERDRTAGILARRVAAWLPTGPSPMDIRRYRMSVFEPVGEKSRVLMHTLRRRLFTRDS